MLDINGYELIVLLVVAIVVLGPERLPEYAAKLGRLVRRLRVLADGARVQLKDQLGPEFDEVDWRQYDPRQYDPRRIVREALADPAPSAGGESAATSSPTSSPLESPGDVVRMPGAAAYRMHDPDRPTPWDPDST